LKIVAIPVRKKLIEVSIPLEAINVASAKEKSIRHGHPSTLHLWWARRPLAACRAVLFAQLVDDPSSWPERFDNDEEKIDAERRRLHKVIEVMVPWEASNNQTILDAARWEIARSVAWGLGEEPPAREDGPAILNYLQTKAPPVYDPFSGGGSIPLEAQRLGLRAYGSDLNPVAVLIGKALVEIPPKFAGRPPVNPKSRAEAVNGELRAWVGAQGLAEDIRYYGQWMRDEAEKRIGHLYPKTTLPNGSQATVIAWLWARTIRSPDPAAKGAMVPLVSSFMLSTKDSNKTWVEPVIDAEAPEGWRFEVRKGALSKSDEERLNCGTKASGSGSSFLCLLTGTPIPFDYARAEAKQGRMGKRLISLVAETGRARLYVSPSVADEVIAAQAVPKDPPEGELPARALGFRVQEYGMTRWCDIYTPRQLTALTTFSDLVTEARKHALQHCARSAEERNGPGMNATNDADNYADAIATFLAFMVSAAADDLSTIVTWRPSHGTGATRSTFARQALPMTWDFAEANPFAGAAGDLRSAAISVARALENVPARGFGEVNQIDAARLEISESRVISTDPPYYDNIGYADLSDFFYVWLRRCLPDVWPDLLRRLVTPKNEELIATPFRHASKIEAEAFFMRGMGAALKGIAKTSSQQTPVTIFYAFKQSEVAQDGITSAGWSSFLQAVVDSGFAVDGTWPVRTERSSRSVGLGTNALASSVVLVCRIRGHEAHVITRAEFIRALKREMPTAIDAIRKAGVGPVDMQQSVIGPGMGVFSRHARVLEDDDSAMGVKTALAVINRVWEEIENELDQAFDPETQVALAWFATYGFEPRASGELITLTTAKNTSDRALFDSGVFKDMRGKAALTPRDELPGNWTPAGDRTLTIWECVQHTARVLNAPDGGGEAAAALVAQMGPKAAEARALAYRLFEIATNKGWAAEALVYNELAQEWTKLEDVAATLDEAGQGPGPIQPSFAFEGTA
jgi:putative DNA methylase